MRIKPESGMKIKHEPETKENPSTNLPYWKSVSLLKRAILPNIFSRNAI